MSRSYERINYALRLAKSIERKMLVEAFRRFSEFRSIDSYRYIGFGSTYFSDFQLIHKSLNIQAMNSLERDVQNRERFEFNKPFRCISMEFGESNVLLPKLPWRDIPTIAWLDYDTSLTSGVLADVKTFCSSASPPSALIVSVNAQPSAAVPDFPNARLDRLFTTLGKQKVPAGIAAKDLREWGTAKIFRKIILNEIAETVADRNGDKPEGSKIVFDQLFNFHYADGAKMLTVGGLLYDRGIAAHVQSCAFDQLTFIKRGEESFFIEPPNLTYREVRHLDTLLPADLNALPTLPGVPNADVRKYAEMYRYFPTFAETEL
jgi:hypothetical protein